MKLLLILSFLLLSTCTSSSNLQTSLVQKTTTLKKLAKPMPPTNPVPVWTDWLSFYKIDPSLPNAQFINFKFKKLTGDSVQLNFLNPTKHFTVSFIFYVVHDNYPMVIKLQPHQRSAVFTLPFIKGMPIYSISKIEPTLIKRI